MKKFAWICWICVLFLACGPLALGGGKIAGEEIEREAATAHPYAVPSADGPVAADGARLVWSETLQHDTATYIAVHFARFALAAGDYVLVRSPDGEQSRRYEGLGRAGLGLDPDGFWATHVKGDTAVVELWSKGPGGGFGFEIDRYSRGLTAAEFDEVNDVFGDPGNGTEAICGADDSEWAPCYETSEPEIYERSRAVMRLLTNGSSLCTGWLVGCEGHMMTNNHCIGNQQEASNTDFEFMVEGASCGTSCASFGSCSGVVEEVSGTLVRTNVGLDYSLVLLPNDHTDDYGYMTLRESGPAVGERIYIPQHPQGWGKRIAVFSSHGADASGFCEVDSLNAPACTGGPGDVGYFADTQGGSSGSPVLGYADHKVVALHHCANCANRGVNIVDVIANLGADMPNCAAAQLAGEIALDRQVANCSDRLIVTVSDDSIAGAGTQQVTALSASESAGESLDLAEVSSGVFSGALDLSGSPGESQDGLLAVQDGEVVTVEYIDADDGSGGTNVPRVAAAQIDCAGPVISAVQVSGVEGAEATVEWSTSEPAAGGVVYSPPPGALADEPAAPVTTHAMTLDGLQDCTTHFFEVTATDPAGNSATDNAGGAYYSFQTAFETTPRFRSVDTPLAIPNGPAAGVSSSVLVSQPMTLEDIEVEVNVTHPYLADLGLVLLTPAGDSITLARRQGGSGDNFTGTRFDDEAAVPIGAGSPPFSGAFQPEQPLSAAYGIDPVGTWTLKVVDSDTTDAGTLDSWSLILTRPAESCGPGSAPPPIPDGKAGSLPLRVARGNAAGTQLELSWDAGCAPAQTKILYGALAQVADHAPTGSVCSVTTPAAVDPAPPGDLWMLVLAEDGTGAESSWGLATAGERNGLQPSGTCGSTVKDLSGTCP